MARHCMRSDAAHDVPPDHAVTSAHDRMEAMDNAWRETAANHRNHLPSNYQRNLLVLTHVPRMALIWVTKLFSSVPMKKQLVQ
jgi:hypothetical protein